MNIGNSEHDGVDVTSFPTSSSVIQKLLTAGFKMIEDFEGISASELAKEAEISQKDALEILRFTGKTSKPHSKGTSALELLKVQTQKEQIVTFCKELDEALGGGVSRGTMTEFCGVPGIGKTQLGMQLAVNVQIPEEFGGCGGECLYIDTEGSFMVERTQQLAQALIHHLQNMHNRTEKQIEAAKNLSVESFLKKIHYYRVQSFIEQVSLINVLPSFLTMNPNIRIIILDSVTFHFRHDFEDMAHRSRLLHGLAQNLSSIAKQFDVAVVLMNQVTTKITNKKQAYLAPALGESWSHACTNRVVLFRKNDGQRYAHLYKSPMMKSTTVAYDITADGVRSARNVKKRQRE